MVAVNITPSQDEQVVPFMKQHRYTFPVYKGNAEIVRAYGVRGAPSEYVIDRQGRAVGMLRLNSDDRAKQFEQIVDKLLAER